MFQKIIILGKKCIKKYPVTKITTVTPLRSENSDFCMKWKIVGEVKLEPYAKAGYSETPTPPENIMQVCNSH